MSVVLIRGGSGFDNLLFSIAAPPGRAGAASNGFGG
jgi:hypothetical protein